MIRNNNDSRQGNNGLGFTGEAFLLIHLIHMRLIMIFMVLRFRCRNIETHDTIRLLKIPNLKHLNMGEVDFETKI